MQNGLKKPQKNLRQYVQYANMQRNESDRHAHRMYCKLSYGKSEKPRNNNCESASTHTQREFPTREKEIATIIFHPYTQNVMHNSIHTFISCSHGFDSVI